MPTETEPNLNFSAPSSELAPFRDPSNLSPKQQFLLLQTLSSYLEDPYTARYLEQQETGNYDGVSGEWDPYYENAMDEATRDTLDLLVEKGKTFLTQELARGLVTSPLSRNFDKREQHMFDLFSKEEYRKHFTTFEADLRPELTEAEEKAVTALVSEKLSRYGQNVDPELLEVYKKREIESYDDVSLLKIKRAFTDTERGLIERGYLVEGQLENDEKFLINRFKHNVVAMQGRMWHLAYGMSSEEVKNLVEPFNFEMTAYGDTSQSEVSDEFYENFVNKKDIDYKEIIKAGFLYVPVRTSTDTISFFEASSRRAKMFHIPDGLNPGDRAIEFDLDRRVNELFTGASETEKTETAQLHYLLMGNLQVRNILEESLNVRLDSMTVDDQVFLSKLLMRATPEQMKAAAGHGPEALKLAARALEFGDDYGDILLDLFEADHSENVGEIIQNIATIRKSGEIIAGQFNSDHEIDQKIAKSMPGAFAKRVTELLAEGRMSGLDSIKETLATIADAAERDARSISEGTFSHANVASNVGSFRDEQGTTLTVRPSGKNARIGLTTKIGKERFSIRLDYEDGKLSLDFGSTATRGVDASDISKRVGADLARGERALAQYRAERGIDDDGYRVDGELHGNHVRETFAHMPELQPEEFAGVVNRFMYRLWYRGQLEDSSTPEKAA